MREENSNPERMPCRSTFGQPAWLSPKLICDSTVSARSSNPPQRFLPSFFSDDSSSEHEGALHMDGRSCFPPMTDYPYRPQTKQLSSYGLFRLSSLERGTRATPKIRPSHIPVPNPLLTQAVGPLPQAPHWSYWLLRMR